MAIRARASIGLRRISAPGGARAATRPSQAAVTRSVRSQMAVINKNLTDIFAQVIDATPDMLIFASKPIMDKADIYVPRDTGDLADSAFLETSTFRGNPTITLGYGKGGRPHYAVFVHEMTDIPHAAPTRAKFFEQAVNEHQGDILPRAAAFLKARGGSSNAS